MFPFLSLKGWECGSPNETRLFGGNFPLRMEPGSPNGTFLSEHDLSTMQGTGQPGVIHKKKA